MVHISPLSPDPRILFELISSIYIASKVEVEINMITACKCDLLNIFIPRLLRKFTWTETTYYRQVKLLQKWTIPIYWWLVRVNLVVFLAVCPKILGNGGDL